MAAKIDSQEIFSNLSSKITNLLYGRTEGDRNIISKTLDELNSLNYRYTIVTSPTKAVLLINQCCTFIPTDDTVLVQKNSVLLTNLINRQNITVEGRTLTLCVQWCLQSLKIREKSVIVDVLQALDAILRSNIQNMQLLLENVKVEICSLIHEWKDLRVPEIVLLGLQCLEACTVVVIGDGKSQNNREKNIQYETVASYFILYLRKKPSNADELIYSKILTICLTGLQNIILQDQSYLQKELGKILGIIKTFMLFGVKGVDFMEPQVLMPSKLSIPEITTNVQREKKGGKLTKQRKHRTSGANKKEKRVSEEWLTDRDSQGYVPVPTTLDYNSDTATNTSNLTSRLKTSDSDFSDNEGGRLSKILVNQGRVRQASLNLFYNVVKNTEKRSMFSFWTSFVPEVALSGKHNLLTCILKDPSPKGRMAALNVLLLLLTSSKIYLSQAETSEKSTAFTPFSVVLGLMLKELHKGLSLALNEVSVPVLTQVLKCFAALVQATPYHKMSPGIVTKVVRNVKSFIYHRDATVQVTALIVLGCILASEPTISETKQAMLRLQQSEENNDKNTHNTTEVDPNSTPKDGEYYAEFSSDEDEDSGTDTPNSRIPWLLKRCLTNLGVVFEEQTLSGDVFLTVPAPVKLESLQVLSAMSRNYFDVLMANHITYITKALDISLSDRYTDLRLHAGRAVDFIGQAINKFLSSEDTKDLVPLGQCVQFWQSLLNGGSLISLLQCEDHSILRAVGCDCLGSIGPQIFEQLSRDKQILCVTLLFSCTRDEENSVKGAAVRALAICVLYPSLREDPGFVVDTADAIYRILHDENLMVRVKASWSLGNLSDALVLNSASNSTDGEELPKGLLLKLLNVSIKGSNDYDKIKMNSVRALGNLLQLITVDLMEENEFKLVTEQAMSGLIQNCSTGFNMKVRWNACYAIGKALKNPALYSCPNNWQSPVFNSLMDLVVNCRNFKVRINAALALASPTSREYYGHFYQITWTCLLKALENSPNMEDFTEYRHRDHLVEQICLALGHLTTVMKKDDLLTLQDPLTLYLELFRNNMHKVLERLVPEKSTSLFSATVTLTNLNSDELNSEQKDIVNKLRDVFATDF